MPDTRRSSPNHKPQGLLLAHRFRCQPRSKTSRTRGREKALEQDGLPAPPERFGRHRVRLLTRSDRGSALGLRRSCAGAGLPVGPGCWWSPDRCVFDLRAEGLDRVHQKPAQSGARRAAACARDEPDKLLSPGERSVNRTANLARSPGSGWTHPLVSPQVGGHRGARHALLAGRPRTTSTPDG